MTTPMLMVNLSHGLHPTAGIWAEVANFPGMYIAAWLWSKRWIADNILAILAVTAAVNWALYFWAVKGIGFLKHKLSKKHATPPPTQLPA
jgi:threonine/homoserine efflux transporter RhtA